ncbi:MAG: hypothetical protein K6F15_03690 [Treponema sp.]|nr:hypothetical protein [Treponema sp.]
MSTTVNSIGDTIEETVNAVLAPLDPTPSVISVPEDIKKRDHSYFAYLPEQIVIDMQNASPSSLRKAASAVRQLDSLYEENNKVLLSIIANVMQMVWVSERLDWETPELTVETSYLGAIKSAKNGIYDTSTGNVDFLSVILPSLVVITVDNVAPFYEASKSALETCLRQNNDSVLANYLMGFLLKKAGRIEESISFFAKAYAGAEESFQTSYAYAEILFLSKRIVEANLIVQKILLRFPQNAEGLKLASKIAYAGGNLNNAEEYISKVLQQNSSDLSSLLFRAKILMEKKDYIHAASLLDMYSRQDNSSKDYLLLRAQIQLDWSRNVNSAVSTIEKALKLYPDDMEVLLFAARLSKSANTPIAGKSVEDYAEKILQGDPDNEDAKFYAVEGAVQAENWELAYKNSSALVEKNKFSKEICFNHIKICLSLKKFDEAWNYISSLYKNNPSDEEVLENYVHVMVSSGRSVQALSVINQLITNASPKLKSSLYYERSFLQSVEEKTLSDLRYSLMSNPRNSSSLFRLYQIYLSKKDYRKAMYYLKQVSALKPNDVHIRQLSDELNSLIR